VTHSSHLVSWCWEEYYRISVYMAIYNWNRSTYYINPIRIKKYGTGKVVSCSILVWRVWIITCNMNNADVKARKNTWIS
jgi:hypothetical protein